MTKRKMLGLVLMLALMCACSPANKGSEDAGNQDTKVKYNESVTYSYYGDYSHVVDIESYLKIDTQNVQRLVEEDDRLVLELIGVETADASDEYIASVYNYIRLMEEKGFETTITDGTISSTFTMENEDNVVSIIMISDLDEWQEVNKEVDYVQDVSNGNCIFVVSQKD